MRHLYSFIVVLTWQILKLVGFVNPKISKFVNGRKGVVKSLKVQFTKNDRIIWLHAASLGEYEQGLPILEELKKEYPRHKILLTFFSPSGYEVKKNASPADLTTYLPLDTPRNVRSFLDAARPELAIFIKYEIWPNYLFALESSGIPSLLISARFSADKIYFKNYGRFMRKALYRFSHIYVQDKLSLELLEGINIKNVRIAGDTRLDRVSKILKRDNTLEIIENFCGQNKCLVAGSTWPDDERILTNYINHAPKDLKFIIAPHTIKKGPINHLFQSIQKKAELYSSISQKTKDDTQVLIIDSIGVLTKIYSYATVAFVGGGFATGLHNTLEPAVFGIPVIIGPNYKGFLEVEDLVKLGGILPIKDEKGFKSAADKLLQDAITSQKIGQINSQYILNNKGASIQIMEGIRTYLK
ncbi:MULTISPECIES: 3-deoxy-D-manno-octulosonic acid transferase [Maribacter]|uniref:3-deoxy-D-manno-octulosonic acid transferase n=1 Tax=Maribacter flavus TaxID=1658664 RepID=A0ABU7IGV5_9FLAO|nr:MULTISPECIES: glycosyltransferase N-terminal domain-containing protein [Maribacter]MDC6404674.1 glycosyltransferase N-terminal domain-containing protein [Maribacter sp. PR66]MEE1972088.1 glycosyltransferase N-terminal domain-containing protein [Maribacter flavus]